MKIVNNEQIPCMYKVLTQHPSKYLISPPYGLLGPNTTIDIQIRLSPPKDYLRYDPFAKVKGSSSRVATSTAFELATTTTSAALEEEGDELAETVRRANRAAQSGSGAFPISMETLGKPVTSVVKIARMGVQTVGLQSLNELEGIEDYLESKTSSAVFKVTLAVVQASMGNPTPQLRFLQRKRTLNKIAAEHVASVYRRMKGRSILKEKNMFEGIFDSVRTVGGILGHAEDAAVALDMTAGKQLLLDSEEVAAAAADIHRDALELFDHLWDTSVLHSTHTVVMKTVAESITEFFETVASKHDTMLQEARQRKASALQDVQRLWAERDAAIAEENRRRNLFTLYRDPSTPLVALGMAVDLEELQAQGEEEGLEAEGKNEVRTLKVLIPKWVLLVAACASFVASAW